MKKMDARKRYTQRVLKASLLELLKRRPINKITVKDVCALAELNRSTFYSHYSDCFDLLDHIEDELVAEFEEALSRVGFRDVTALIVAIYEIIDKHEEACRTLIFNNTNASVIQRMIEAAREKSIAEWKLALPGATNVDLEMLYTHLSNGLMNVVVKGHDVYSRESVIRFVNRAVRNSLSLFQ